VSDYLTLTDEDDGKPDEGLRPDQISSENGAVNRGAGWSDNYPLRAGRLRSCECQRRAGAVLGPAAWVIVGGGPAHEDRCTGRGAHPPPRATSIGLMRWEVLIKAPVGQPMSAYHNQLVSVWAWTAIGSEGKPPRFPVGVSVCPEPSRTATEGSTAERNPGGSFIVRCSSASSVA